MAPRNVLLALLRNDLRLHDHPIFHLAADPTPAGAGFAQPVTHVLPVYVLDQAHVEVGGLPGIQKHGKGKLAQTRTARFWRTGERKLEYLVNSLFDLKSSLRARNSDLSLWAGLPEVVVPQLVRQLQAGGDRVEGVWFGKEVNTEEVNTEKRLASALSDLSVRLVQPFDRTLVHLDDLGFPIKDLPDVFTSFRKRVEGPEMYRLPVDAPSKFKPFPQVKLDDAPGCYALEGKEGLSEAKSTYEKLVAPLRENPGPIKSPRAREPPQQSAFPFKGGETEALKRLDHYLGAGRPGQKYKETRNGMLGVDYSTKFSAALAHGTISPRLIAKRAEDMDNGGRGGGYWVVFELLWRDYFQFVGLKYGSALFTLEGIEAELDSKAAKQKMQQWLSPDSFENQNDAFVRWTQGRTGVPLIDANMLELAETGFMSNRGRQNVASFLTKDLYYDWRLGAEWFESMLSDYDPNSNWGNWQYVAGVGNDPRSSRQFNPIKQANDYDPTGSYVRAWLPQLRALPDNVVQHPWTADQKPDDYPHSPVVETPSWKAHYGGGRGGGGRGRGRGRGGRGGRGGGGGRGGQRGQNKGRPA